MENFQHDTGRFSSHLTVARTGQKQDGSFAQVFDATDTDGVQGQIGLRLRAVYEAIVAEPVPDRILSLLESLDCSTDKKPGSNPT